MLIQARPAMESEGAGRRFSAAPLDEKHSTLISSEKFNLSKMIELERIDRSCYIAVS
jgi:hypothetical protein